MSFKLLSLVAFLFLINFDVSGTTRDIKRNADDILTNRDSYGRLIVKSIRVYFHSSVAIDPACNTKEDFYCNGLMVSGFEESDPLYWTNDLQHLDHGKLSMTYFNNKTKSYLYDNTGFILWPQFQLDYFFNLFKKNNNAFKLKYHCAFPYDGGTDGRNDNGCGMMYDESKTKPCQLLGITSADEWISYYGDIAQLPNSCGFDLTDLDSKRSFEAVLSLIDKLKETQPEGQRSRIIWNEVVLEGWPAQTPSRVPVMAFFNVTDNKYIDKIIKTSIDSNHRNSSLNATDVQQAFYDKTGIFVPIIDISGVPDDPQFNYSPEHQSNKIAESVNVLPE